MKRILIADDESNVKRILVLMLERQGYEVVTVSNGEEAIKCINDAPPDVLITDIVMPRMTGKKLCQAIERDYPERNFLILVMTSSTERDERRWVKDISNIEFLEKPLSPRQLADRLKRYFEDSDNNTEEHHE